MPRAAKHQLTIDKREGKRPFFLSGYIDGKQTRRKFSSMPEAEAVKNELEAKHNSAIIAEANKPVAQYTYLTNEQLRDAEAAFRVLHGKSYRLLDCVITAVSADSR